MHEVAGTKTATGAPSLRSTFEGLSSVFARMSKQGRHVKLDEAAVKDVKALLFGPAVSIEAVRLVRAEAIVAMVKAEPLLGSEIAGEVRELMTGEMSSQVRDRLSAAIKSA